MYCKWIRWRWLGKAESSSLPYSIRKHLQECPSCCAYYEQLSLVETRLRQECPEFPSWDCQDFEGKVLMTLRQASAVQSASRFHFPVRGLFSAAAAAVLLLGVGLFFWKSTRTPTPPAESLTLNPFRWSLPSELYTLQNQLIEKSMMAYEAELYRLSGDMKSAVQFVAACLPSVEIPPEIP